MNKVTNANTRHPVSYKNKRVYFPKHMSEILFVRSVNGGICLSNR